MGGTRSSTGTQTEDAAQQNNADQQAPSSALQSSSSSTLGVNVGDNPVTNSNDPAGALDEASGNSSEVYDQLPASGGESGGAESGDGGAGGAESGGADQQGASTEGKTEESAQTDSTSDLIDELATGAAAASALIGSTSGRINWKRKKP